jgi:hypothetical protein
MRFADKPVNIAVPIAAIEAAEGLREWVPEAVLSGIRLDPGGPCGFILTAEVEISDAI